MDPDLSLSYVKKYTNVIISVSYSCLNLFFVCQNMRLDVHSFVVCGPESEYQLIQQQFLIGKLQ